MAQIPILNGIYADAASEFRTLYPRNLIPVPKVTGISRGYLRPSNGIVRFDTQAAPGFDRGGYNWKGQLLRAMGSRLVIVGPDGSITDKGEIGGTGQVTFHDGFDRLGIASNNNLFYWSGSALSQVTDPDLGQVVDFIWVDGYFMTTDGNSLIVTELTNPLAVNPLKYGSSEADPDPILAVLKVKNEPWALNRYTIECFQNIGGDLFPFQRIEGAQIQKGVIGTHACCQYMDTVAFLGSGRDESPAIYHGVNSNAEKLSTREIDTILQGYTEEVLAYSVMEAQIDKGHNNLLLHLPDQTLVYDRAASMIAEEPVWYTLDSGVAAPAQYQFRNLIWCYNKWIGGDPGSAKLGYYANTVASHYGAAVGWAFGTQVVYNMSTGGIIHELELVSLPGNVPLGVDPTVWTSYSVDGRTWSQEIPTSAGKQGDYTKRIHWLGQGVFKNWRIQKFRGSSECMTSFARLEARIEGLNF